MFLLTPNEAWIIINSVAALCVNLGLNSTILILTAVLSKLGGMRLKILDCLESLFYDLMMKGENTVQGKHLIKCSLTSYFFLALGLFYQSGGLKSVFGTQKLSKTIFSHNYNY